ncbi:glycosyltransferase family 4 protein [Mycolicibacterium sp. 018/SC-01/001]|nr:glycosyltransferase family 4 protein [Mycolicibacterium sp. 018/SC-01/001]
MDAEPNSRLLMLLPDPVPPDADQPGQWWPPRWLDPRYLLAHIGEIDVLHVHFGFESVAHRDLVAVADVLAAHAVPLVVTVHDLANPHLADQAAHRAKLATLVHRADAVTTLTDGAAREIRERWGVAATVLPHPHLLPLGAVGHVRERRHAPIIAVHAKFLRANIDPWPVLDALAAEYGSARHVSLRLDLDDNALTSPRADADMPGRLAVYRDRGVDVRVHPPFTDDELVDFLREIDILVLPYRFGTHSGWVEACHDSGVVPVVPDCGHLHEQRPCATFGFGIGRFDDAGLRSAVDDAVERVRRRPDGDDLGLRRARAQEREQVRHETARLYRRLSETSRSA